MIVVDANVLAYLWLPGEHTAEAEKLFRADPEWAAPLLWKSEICSVVLGMYRRRQISLEVGFQVLEAAASQLQGREFAVSSDRVLQLAADSACSSYDCEYVVLAQDLKVALVTADKAVLRAFPKVARPLWQI